MEALPRASIGVSSLCSLGNHGNAWLSKLPCLLCDELEAGGLRYKPNNSFNECYYYYCLYTNIIFTYFNMWVAVARHKVCK